MSKVPNLRKSSWISSKLERGTSSIHGRGLFTTETIAKDETVIIFGGYIFTDIDILKGRADVRTLTRIDEKTWFGNRADSELGAEYFINHSCEPNLWYSDEVTLVAREPIPLGAEITIDYGTEIFEPDWRLKDACNCHSHACRTQITGNDWKLPELQRKYAGHYAPYLNKKIDSLQSDGS